MILTYSKPEFEPAILHLKKLHTLRRDPKKRWKEGMRIQHWMGNPRNTRAAVKPYQFGTGICMSVQDIQINRVDTSDPEKKELFPFGYYITMIYDNSRILMAEQYEYAIANNDGLSPEEFREFFVPESDPIWIGRIIHFTNTRYFDYVQARQNIQPGGTIPVLPH